MARITIEDCLKRPNNRFVLVEMSIKRSKQLLRGSTPLVDVPDNREIATSLREIAQGKVLLDQHTKDSLQKGGLITPDEEKP
jgi:DNA-directed RNA polymerase subunit omega